MSQKKSEEQINSTQLSIIPAGTQIVFVIYKIVMHTLGSLVMKTINERSDVNKDKLFEELLRNIICVFLKYTLLDEDTQDMLRKRMNCMIYKLSEGKDDITATFSKLGKYVESIYQNLQERFPNIECVHLMSKAIETNCVDESVWNSILSDLKQINQSIELPSFTKQEFLPSQEQLIPEEMQIHYYIASNQFHKMISKRINMPRKQVCNTSDAIESITYIHNAKQESAFENQKELFKQQKKVDQHGPQTSLLIVYLIQKRRLEEREDDERRQCCLEEGLLFKTFWFEFDVWRWSSSL